jgi:hypothetical protein
VIVILIIGFVVALILKSITAGALRKLGLDRRLDRSPAHNIVRRLTDSPSEAVGKLVYWLAVIVTITIAIAAMNVPVFNQFLTGVYGYVPNILAAIVILALALGVSTGVSGLIIRLMGDTPTGKIVSTVVPVIILSIAGFAILEQLRIAPAIVTITYTALIGSLALGFAIALGLGAKGVAEQMFQTAYETGRKNIGQVKKDIEKGKERGQREADEQRRKFEEENK